MKAKVSSIIAIICLVTLVFFCILACDNGSASGSSSNTDGLVKVSLSVGESSGSQKSISVNSSIDPANLKYYYKAIPQWSQSRPIHGSTNNQFVMIPNYSAGANLGYFTAGQWEIIVQIRNGGTVIYQGSSGVISVYEDNFAVNVVVNKIIELAAGSVSVSVTAPTVDGEAMTVGWSGTATGSGSATATPQGDGTTLFTFTKSDYSSGYYTFTLNHSATGGGAAVAVDLRYGERAEITGHIENGAWQVGCVTVKVHEITKNFEGCNYQINVNSAAAGDKVSFYIEPFAGNILQGTVNVTWTGGSIGELVPVNGLYTFEMPDADVTINAIYSGVDSAINVAHFMAIMKILFDSNPGVTYFGRSANPPSNEVEYFEVKNMKLWCQNHQILWYTSSQSVTFQAGSMCNLFKDQSTLATVDLRGFNTAAVTDMAGMFQNCSALATLTFDTEKDANGGYVHFDTSSVEDMSQMFYGCNTLASLDLSGFKTGNVESMAKMFMGCEGLTAIVLDSEKVEDSEDPRYGKFLNFDTSNVTDMSYMFSSGTVDVEPPSAMILADLDVSGFDTSKVTNMSHMFYMCYLLSTLDVSGFRTPLVKDMTAMFACYNYGARPCPGRLTVLNLSGWNFTNVTSTAKMFDRQELLNTGLQFPSETNFKSLTNMYFMFSQCRSLTPAHLGTIIRTWKFSEQTNYMTTVYGNSTTSLFGRYGENSNNAPNYLIRDKMLKGGTYANFATGQDYLTADDQHLYIGGKNTIANCYLTVKTGDR